MWRLDGNVVVVISRTRARRASPSTPPNSRSSPGDQVLQETAARRAFERARERWREKTGCTRSADCVEDTRLGDGFRFRQATERLREAVGGARRGSIAPPVRWA
jgi:hypothetical protein